MAETEDERPILVVKKIKKGGGGHHGGAWKVAYADFVTAMMAFFLLMWLLNVTTQEEKNAISNFYDPTHPKISEADSGSGGVLGGMTISPEGARVSNVQPLAAPQTIDNTIPARQSDEAKNTEQQPDQIQTQMTGTGEEKQNDSEGLSAEEIAEKKAEQERFDAAEEALKQAIQESPELKELAKNLLIDQTPEGLRIQIVDQEGESMFPIGSARMYKKTEKLLGLITGIIKKLPNKTSIRGHTDSAPYPDGATYNNWDLSSDRANASRRVMIAQGIEPERVSDVVGKADTEHLVPENPLSPQNRRISIIMLRGTSIFEPEPTPEVQIKEKEYGPAPAPKEDVNPNAQKPKETPEDEGDEIDAIIRQQEQEEQMKNGEPVGEPTGTGAPLQKGLTEDFRTIGKEPAKPIPSEDDIEGQVPAYNFP